MLVAPPKYAPEVPNLITLYDTIFDALVRSGHYPAIYENGFWKSGKDGFQPNFHTEIRPLLERATYMPWVAAIPPKPHHFDFGKLGATGPDGLGAPELQASASTSWISSARPTRRTTSSPPAARR